MVRLKERNEMLSEYFIHEFQFHNGSIKRDKNKGATPMSNTFQFHNGSIKSLDIANNRIVFKDFNSTMVRLKGLTDENTE
mgnify:CR=1 FL=1